MSQLECSMCNMELPLMEDNAILTVVVTDPDGDMYAGHICSTECLIDYVAKIRLLELEEEG